MAGAVIPAGAGPQGAGELALRREKCSRSSVWGQDEVGIQEWRGWSKSPVAKSTEAVRGEGEARGQPVDRGWPLQEAVTRVAGAGD